MQHSDVSGLLLPRFVGMAVSPQMLRCFNSTHRLHTTVAEARDEVSLEHYVELGEAHKTSVPFA